MLVAERGGLNAFPAMPRYPFSLVCPYCGCIHRSARQRILWATVIILIVLLLVLISGIHPGSADQPDRSMRYSAEPRTLPLRSITVPLTTSTPTVTSLPATTPTLTPTPLPIPTTGVIWNRENAGSYFWEAPGKGILSQLPNGTIVTFLEDWQAYGGLGWASVEFDGQTGWVNVVDIFRVTIPEGGFSQVVAAEGTYLYSEPQGQHILWLSPSTPFRIGQKMQVVNSQTWVSVGLLNGTEGWMKKETIQETLLPVPIQE